MRPSRTCTFSSGILCLCANSSTIIWWISRRLMEPEEVKIFDRLVLPDIRPRFKGETQFATCTTPLKWSAKALADLYKCSSSSSRWLASSKSIASKIAVPRLAVELASFTTNKGTGQQRIMEQSIVLINKSLIELRLFAEIIAKSYSPDAHSALNALGTSLSKITFKDRCWIFGQALANFLNSLLADANSCSWLLSSKSLMMRIATTSIEGANLAYCEARSKAGCLSPIFSSTANFPFCSVIMYSFVLLDRLIYHHHITIY